MRADGHPDLPHAPRINTARTRAWIAATPEGTAILLPVDPDGSARALRAALQRATGHAPLAVVITPLLGRAWRRGQVDQAIGVAGLTASRRSPRSADASGRALAAAQPALADELAAAAGLARGKADRTGVVVISGIERQVGADDGPAQSALVRPTSEDLFR